MGAQSSANMPGRWLPLAQESRFVYQTCGFLLLSLTAEVTFWVVCPHTQCNVQWRSPPEATLLVASLSPASLNPSGAWRRLHTWAGWLSTRPRRPMYTLAFRSDHPETAMDYDIRPECQTLFNFRRMTDGGRPSLGETL